MQWTSEAENALKKVPFFVRKRVRARVEKEACHSNKTTVSLADVNATQKRYLSGMASEVKGYQLDTCFGPAGCPNRISNGNGLMEEVEQLLKAADFRSWLRAKGITKPKFHHEFRVTLADCPNACSQPQIKDIGIIAACRPQITQTPCSGCGACVEACREGALSLDGESPDITPNITLDDQCCVACGHCIPVCSTGTLEEGPKGYRIQLGGKLGRHPQLAREMPGIYDASTVLAIVRTCIDLYKTRSIESERFGAVLSSSEWKRITDRFKTEAVQK